MPNSYGLPEAELTKIRARDAICVYCKKAMVKPSDGGPQAEWATIEHLNFLPPWNNPATVVICCGRCNSSRSNKSLNDWFKTPYCVGKGITENTVAEPVKKFISDRKLAGLVY